MLHWMSHRFPASPSSPIFTAAALDKPMYLCYFFGPLISLLVPKIVSSGLKYLLIIFCFYVPRARQITAAEKRCNLERHRKLSHENSKPSSVLESCGIHFHDFWSSILWKNDQPQLSGQCFQFASADDHQKKVLKCGHPMIHDH